MFTKVSALKMGVNSPKKWVGTIFVILWLLSSLAFGDKVCKFTYKGTAEDLSDTTISVQEEMVAVSEYIYVSSKTYLDSIPDTPSIFFVIDNSSSMWGGNSKDKWGARFKVTSGIIDILNKDHPNAEVGVGVFGEYLFFRQANDPTGRLAKCPKQDSGAYIPLFKLNQSYPPDGKSGYQILKDWLKVDTLNDAAGERIDLTYRPNPNWSDSADPNTNITAGFDAAVHAMKKSSRPDSSQYVIFFSDGEANRPSNLIEQNRYRNGDTVPTTFTIFFTGSSNPPANLVTMTNNIRANGYSSSNPNSKIWPFDNNSNDLMQFVLQNVLTLISRGKVAKPKTITFGGSNGSTWDSTGFALNKILPLTGEVTTFNADIVYGLYDPNGVFIKDTTHKIRNFKVKIDPSVNNISDTFDVKCWDRFVNFRYNNRNITVANETMNQLSVRFNNEPGEAKYNYTNAKMILRSKVGGDSETLTMTGNTNDFSVQFSREIGSAAPGDGKLQHAGHDTLVAVFYNSEATKLPLDSLKEEIVFVLGSEIVIASVEYWDKKLGAVAGADGLVDEVLIKLTSAVNSSQLGELKSVFKFEGRSFTYTDSDFSLTNSNKTIKLNVTESANPARTSTDNTDKCVVTKLIYLNSGGWIKQGSYSVIDKMAPVINKASLVDFQDPNKTDSLTIEFSEPVNTITHAQPFKLYQESSKDIYRARVQRLATSDVNVLFSIVGFQPSSISGVGAGDSIWIRPSNYVADKLNQFQSVEKNIRRPINLNFILNPFNIEIISVTPFNINDPNINNYSDTINLDPINIQELINYGNHNNNQYHGMLIQVRPDDITDLHKDFLLEGELSIYDPVGNAIILAKNMGYHKSWKTLVYIWSGRNANGRKVARGTYLAVSNFTVFPKGKNYPELSRKEVDRTLLGVVD